MAPSDRAGPPFRPAEPGRRPTLPPAGTMPPVRPALGTPAGTGAARATIALRPAVSCAGHLCVRARSVQPQSHFSSLRFARTANRPGCGFFAALARRCPSQTVPENAATRFQPPADGGPETATRPSAATPVRAPVFLV